ncbi:tetraacyldisaccharide 4'-kinase [Labilibaculum sp. A4]|uniref:Tetraacyldisaccharide 4'-kinase n=1 Tax=Labilibaculum euxinus TaxID=2686357 RepID=A0A425Y9I2_9BACT|nr:tetraacyldisaccharide 4'-kinase [Labilibaculum euxinus]MDQ1770034.1 tetraacyldisaccharide 4'-kinase [Labilibaculum euxinus]MUP38719.1 tetraacyldisaccharide 4'-kinase [Labilibaculum euxinus]MVB07924.1 tetraacyldisaccharide 4'-kinase [Labilibaculum euxinus]MWN77456.1 tetraacyldisaccharide 4'-kinase [Labilibaculum euxinus]
MKKLSPILKSLLFPFSLLYGLIVSVRNLLFDFNILPSTEFKIPIISVGNITVGGTGKTPHIEYLITLLKDDYKIATLSRGYKRKSKGYILADGASTSYQIGDEPMQIKRKFPDILVSVDKKRVNGVKNLLQSEHGTDLAAVLLDDAFQHRSIKAGLSILLIDYNRPITQDYIMPYGRLRESAGEKDRANIIIVSKSPENMTPIDRRIIVKELDLLPFQSLYFTSLDYGNLEPVFRDNAINIINEDWDKDNFSILLVTGIANPKPLREYLENFSDLVEELKFPDHYSFGTKDIDLIHSKFEHLKGENKIIVTTEKDATRFYDMDINHESIKKHLFYIPLRIKFLNEDKSKFDVQIMNYVQKNKRSSNLHNIKTDSI